MQQPIFSALPFRPLSRSCTTPLQTLSQPVRQFRLAQLGEVVDTLFAEVDAAEVHVLRRRLADSLHDDGRVGLEDDAVVNDLVNGEGDKVVVLDDCALIDRLPE